MQTRKTRLFRMTGMVALFAAFVLILAACTQAVPGGATEAPASSDEAAAAEGPSPDEYEGELTLAIWGQIDADPQHSAYSYHEILQQWNDAHPNIDLKYEVIGGASVPERFTWIKTHMLAGTLPDVVMIYFPSDDFRDPDLVYDLASDLDQPSPYSDNATWRDDFPQDAVLLNEWAGPNGENFFVGPTLSGDTGVTSFLYNKDIFDEVGVEPPTTWAEFMDIQQKIKDAGYTPFFQPITGPLGWLINWPRYAIEDQLLDDVIRACDFEDPKDNISVKELTWCVKSGTFRADDPRYMETMRILKDWSPYWQEGFLAPPAEGDPFVSGDVAMEHTMNLWIGRYLANPDIDFEWGTFYEPPVTEETTDLVEDVFIRRVGNTGAAASGSQFLMIPKTTVDDGKLAIARDLAQYTTAPEQLQYWCEHQPIPCFDPGTPIEDVYPDQPDTWQHLRGFFEPGSYQNGIRSFDVTTFGSDAGSTVDKLFQEYLGDAISVEEMSEEIQAVLDEEADKAIREHPEWNADEWEADAPPSS